MGLYFHIYADDTQIFISFDPKIPYSDSRAIQSLQDCINDLSEWMATNHFKLNMDKTEFIIFGTSHNLRMHSSLVLKVGNATIKPSNSVRNLGVNLDSTLSI